MIFEKIGISNLLKRYWLEVPPNQRDYAWKEKQVESLFSDIANAISEGKDEYFIGTIVTIMLGNEKLSVVDGQQRLATTSILLRQIKNYLNKISAPSEDAAKDYLYSYSLDHNGQRTKLQLNVSDNQFFTSMILNPSALPEAKRRSTKLLKKAFEIAGIHIENILSALKPVHHEKELSKWIKFLDQNVRVIHLSVESSSNAYKMFETLNDRGLKVSQADLVKSYLFEQASLGNQLIEAQHKWSSMQASLESFYTEEGITVRFLRHVLIFMTGHVKDAEVFDVTQTQANGAVKALKFLDNLEKYSNTYVAITSPDNEKWNDYPDSIRRSISTLNEFDIKVYMPLFLAIAEKFSAAEASEAF